ncbi:hypothetical protein [Mycolicibacterium arseniciresistens]|uniref:Uncharacterized protein n=1 Tax=Mycolicibacterium arseniciresistens TaxID=3062257 RepID=A0ABT8UA02_9MYCO|nr:hypothetical protein [Mycolicibacterium arseniciresistens]MDO3634622.1 hypothetical protein [Mycolicibacterium arseniciresistens]
MTQSPTTPAATGDPAGLRDDMRSEYGKLIEIVNGFDQRLLTIKGWGVTLSLASLGLAFQQGHAGLFLVASTSGLAFWALEASTKSHQVHYYLRMRDIEIACYELFGVATPEGTTTSSPLIDWSWSLSERQRKSGQRDRAAPPRLSVPGRNPWFHVHVMLPHLVAVILGAVLFVLELRGVINDW